MKTAVSGVMDGHVWSQEYVTGHSKEAVAVAFYQNRTGRVARDVRKAGFDVGGREVFVIGGQAGTARVFVRLVNRKAACPR